MSDLAREDSGPGSLPSFVFSRIGYCIALCAVVFAVYGQVHDFGHVYYDDAIYVYQNPMVNTGLSWENIRWAFSIGYAANWHPVTWLSHMLDVSIFGRSPGNHHVVSLLIHLVNSLLLFVVFRRATGNTLIGAGISFLFAVHPLRAESVAWISERKDVLFMLWGMLSLLFYLKFVKSRRALHYSLVALFFGLGLMSKPMIITFPVVLLLFDYWPLNRLPFDSQSFWKEARTLVYEKIPLFAMTLAACLVTLLAQQIGGGLRSMSELSLDLRVANATVAYVDYIGMMLWPSGLAFHYPHQLRSMGDSEFGLSVTILVLITALFWKLRTRQPYFLMGWLWYLVTMLPVIGFVQVGYQGMADRYTYFTQIGLGIILVYLVKALFDSKLVTGRELTALSLGTSLLLAAATYNQVRTWRSLFTISEHALQVTTRNYRAHFGMGLAYVFQQEDEKAVVELRKALMIVPTSGQARLTLDAAEERLRQKVMSGEESG